MKCVLARAHCLQAIGIDQRMWIDEIISMKMCKYICAVHNLNMAMLHEWLYRFIFSSKYTLPFRLLLITYASRTCRRNKLLLILLMNYEFVIELLTNLVNENGIHWFMYAIILCWLLHFLRYIRFSSSSSLHT